MDLIGNRESERENLSVGREKHVSALMRENPNGRKGFKSTRALGTVRELRGSTPQSERHPSKIKRRFIQPQVSEKDLLKKVKGEVDLKGFRSRANREAIEKAAQEDAEFEKRVRQIYKEVTGYNG